MAGSVIAHNQYGAYCVPLISKHRPAARAILSGNVYEPKTIDFLRAIPGAIIHAGAYFGDFLPALSKSRKATVYAFEPNPINYECSEMTCKLNKLRNVELTHAALGDKTGIVHMETWGDDGRNLGGMSHIADSGIESNMVRLDDVIPLNEKIGAIHLDTEFYEEHVLNGARRLIENCLPVLVLETLPDDMRWLHSLGYQVRRKVHWNHILSVV